VAGIMGVVRRPWTTASDYELRKLIERGVSRAEIAFELGRTKEAIKRRAYALGLALRLNQNNLPGEPWSDGDRAILAAAWVAGTPVFEIAKSIPNRKESSIRRYAALMGLKRPKREPKSPKSHSKSCFKGPVDLTDETNWRLQCHEANERFCQAMEANPSERPTNLPEERQGYVRRVGMRFPSRPPSWSSMGDIV
jgi:glutathione S-transferase